MLTPEQIPYEVTRKVKELVVEMGFFGSPIRDFEASEIAAAAINAWPGMGRFEDETGWDVHIELPLLVPLPMTEPRDDTV